MEWLCWVKCGLIINVMLQPEKLQPAKLIGFNSGVVNLVDEVDEPGCSIGLMAIGTFAPSRMLETAISCSFVTLSYFLSPSSDLCPVLCLIIASGTPLRNISVVPYAQRL